MLSVPRAWLDLAKFRGLEHQLVDFAPLEAAFEAAFGAADGEAKATFGAAAPEDTFNASSLARLAKFNPVVKC
jgi:hypothetical protein